MVKINCFTNLDLINEKWPTELPEVPRVDDFIRSAQIWVVRPDDGSNQIGIGYESQLELRVVRVTWDAKQRTIKDHLGCMNEDIWTPRVELHLPKGRWESITKFYEWYGRITGKGKSYFI